VGRFSLVMATVGRTGEVGRFLASLDAQNHRDFELIVVDQNPDDRLGPVLAPYSVRFPVHHLKSPARGASRARNLGLDRATGDLLAFPDDDCLYPAGLLSAVDGFFARNPSIDGLTCRSVDEGGNTSNGRFPNEAGFVDRINVWGRGIEYAMFFRHGSVRGLRFDEVLGVGAGTPWGAGEATDYLLRLLEGGGVVYYDPALAVVHPPPVAAYDGRAARKAYAYGSGMGRVLKAHRMPLRLKARWLYRPLGGAALSLARRRPDEARFRWSTFRGRLRGML